MVDHEMDQLRAILAHIIPYIYINNCFSMCITHTNASHIIKAFSTSSAKWTVIEQITEQNAINNHHSSSPGYGYLHIRHFMHTCTIYIIQGCEYNLKQTWMNKDRLCVCVCLPAISHLTKNHSVCKYFDTFGFFDKTMHQKQQHECEVILKLAESHMCTLSMCTYIYIYMYI